MGWVTAENIWLAAAELMAARLQGDPVFCSSSNDFFEPLEISNYCTPVPRAEP